MVVSGGGGGGWRSGWLELVGWMGCSWKLRRIVELRRTRGGVTGVKCLGAIGFTTPPVHTESSGQGAARREESGWVSVIQTSPDAGTTTRPSSCWLYVIRFTSQYVLPRASSPIWVRPDVDFATPSPFLNLLSAKRTAMGKERTGSDPPTDKPPWGTYRSAPWPRMIPADYNKSSTGT